MSLLLQQIKKISPFLYILIFLFIINIIFNINYKWDGLTVLIRVYLFIFSFYLTYISSSIDLKNYLLEYEKKYGWKGKHFLFFISRGLPFLVIYFITILFTLINFFDKPNWPFSPLLEILNGKNVNVVIYSLILLFTLKIKRSPKITIPIFISASIIYLFILDKLFYSHFPGGWEVSFIKNFKLFSVYLFLIFEFYYKKSLNKIKSFFSFLGLVLSLTFLTYFLKIIMLFLAFTFSSVPSNKIKSGNLILKLGFPYPLENLTNLIKKQKGSQDDLKDLIYYTNKYDFEIKLNSAEWESLFFSNSIEVADLISVYLKKNKIILPFPKLITFVKNKSFLAGEKLLEANHFIFYTAETYQKQLDFFHKELKEGSEIYREWLLKVIIKMKRKKSLHFLIDLLSNINSFIAEKAYFALVELTGLNPIKEKARPMNSPEVIKIFRDYTSSERTD